ncbi:MAG: aspartate kinase [Candidatus Dormibacteria bacterium]
MSDAGPLRVLKFGGTSLGDAARIRQAVQTVGEQAVERSLVVVVSALAGVTDELARAALAASQGKERDWRRLDRSVRERHLQVCRELLGGEDARIAEVRLLAPLAHFRDLCAGISLVREIPPRTRDSLISLGEVLAATLVAAALQRAGLPAESVDAGELIVSDDVFGDAHVLFAPTRRRVRTRLLGMRRRRLLPVVTGFRAATADGSTTSLGRGGSDYTATVLGAALDAEAVWIFTDVDGMMTADPRLVPEAQVIPALSYREATELAFFGARVLHPKALELPRLFRIPVLIKNSFAPERPGTRIADPGGAPAAVSALASTTTAALFTVAGGDTTGFTRLAALVTAWLDAERVPTLMVTQSSAENVLSFVINASDRPRVARRLERERGRQEALVAAVEQLSEVGMVVAVGEEMRGTPGIAARLFGAVAAVGVNVIAIAQGSSELSISLVVGSGDVPTVVRALHREFAL